MARKIRYRRTPCAKCRDMITTNALGRAAHMRHCNGVPKVDKRDTDYSQPRPVRRVTTT
jgi:hypothetical protein